MTKNNHFQLQKMDFLVNAKMAFQVFFYILTGYIFANKTHRS